MEESILDWQPEQMLSAHQQRLVTLFDFEQRINNYLEASHEVHMISRFIYQHVICAGMDAVRAYFGEDLSGTYESRTESIFDRIGSKELFHSFMQPDEDVELEEMRAAKHLVRAEPGSSY